MQLEERLSGLVFALVVSNGERACKPPSFLSLSRAGVFGGLHCSKGTAQQTLVFSGVTEKSPNSVR